MITYIEGTLVGIESGAARIDPGGGLTYEVMLPAFAAGRLPPRIGEAVRLCTVHYLEGASQGTTLTPRLAGFLNETDRDFYVLFTSVKGIGTRKALRAMTLSSERIAAAIADRDVKTLQSLPEIGRRMAETIIASLHGKIDRFCSAAAFPESDSSGDAVDTSVGRIRGAAREALEVLLQLGENRAAAAQWIDQVTIKDPDLDDATEIVTRVLRIKGGG